MSDSRPGSRLLYAVIACAAALSSLIVIVAIENGRIDRLDAKAQNVELATHSNRSMVEHLSSRVEKLDLSSVRTELQLCRRRTESLRGVLEVLIPSGIWPERVRLPDPPPGWEAWPVMGGLDGRGGEPRGTEW